MTQHDQMTKTLFSNPTKVPDEVVETGYLKDTERQPRVKVVVVTTYPLPD
jgi:hypothetical protein